MRKSQPQTDHDVLAILEEAEDDTRDIIEETAELSGLFDQLNSIEDASNVFQSILQAAENDAATERRLQEAETSIPAAIAIKRVRASQHLLHLHDIAMISAEHVAVPLILTRDLHLEILLAIEEDPSNSDSLTREHEAFLITHMAHTILILPDRMPHAAPPPRLETYSPPSFPPPPPSNNPEPAGLDDRLEPDLPADPPPRPRRPCFHTASPSR